MAKFDALFFDMDGTLVESKSLARASFYEGFDKAGYEISLDPWPYSGRTDNDIIEEFLTNFGLTGEHRKEEKEKIVGFILQSIFRMIRENGLKANPGVIELISKLNELKLYPGLLTGNMEVIVEPKLRAAGMKREDFSYGGFGDDSTCRADTARKALASASEFLGFAVDPERCLVIGDTPNDIKCARAVGAKALAVATGKFTAEELLEHQPDYFLPDLTDTAQFLEIIGA